MAEERRLVTVLFADVVGSTALGEALDPEDVRALLARLFSIATEAVERHGGRVEKFIGDAIMAVFGSPVAHDDDPARALSAAMELRDRVRADAVLTERVPIRLGINGGEVIASRDANAQILVTGDPINTAARIQAAADPWSILVGERTVKAVGDQFVFGAPIAIEAKGKAVPVSARELQGVTGFRAQRRRTKLVGRDTDLDQLELVARRTFEEGRPSLVSIVAPAGVGKSRLLEEFLDRMPSGAEVAMAQCLPYGQRLTFWPMRAILLSIVGRSDDTTPDELRQAVVAWLRRAGEPDAERTADLLAATVGASEIEGDRLAMFAAWRRLVELAAERNPLVLVIEDLHWSSDSLLDLVEAMLQPRADVPLMMIALARPELLDRRPGWGGGRRNAVSIALEPLPQRAVEALVADLLEHPSPEIVTAVVDRAEGNPFYAGEIVRALVDRLGPSPDPSAVSGAIAALPDTVHATVLARLDALEAVPRRVVQLGAVLGRTFEPRAIAVVDPSISADAVDSAIGDLQDRDLIRTGQRGQMTFRHILIREVAYNTLPRAERARLHAAAGTWLAGVATSGGREDELSELIAFHLREAISLSSLTADGVPPELPRLAVEWLRRAADSAAAGAASGEAARHLNAALELADLPERPDLYERLGQIWTGGDQSAQAFEQAYRLGRELALDDDQALRTVSQLMIVRSRWVGSVGHKLDEATQDRYYAQIEQLIESESVTPRSRLFGLMALGFRPMIYDYATHEQTMLGKDWANRALEAARAFGDPNLISEALDGAGIEPMGDDRMTEVIALNEERHAIEERISTEERTDAWIVHAWAETIRGNLVSADRAAERVRAGLLAGQASSFVLGATCWRIVALYGLGQWDEVPAELLRAERAWAESEVPAPGYATNGFIAAMHVARGRGDTVAFEHARELVQRIYERIDEGARSRRQIAFIEDDLEMLAEQFVGRFRTFSPRLDYVFLALTRLADRRYPVALDVLDELVAYAESRELRLIDSQARRLRGLVRGDAGDLEQALATFLEIGMQPFVARARTELGLLRGDNALVEQGLDDLSALGDIEQGGRVAALRASVGR